MLANLTMTKELLLSDIVKNQAILNVGCIGHVSNGKSTLVRQMTGIKTQKFKSEKERNCTINVGYGNCKIYYSSSTDEYKYTGSNTFEESDSEGNPMELIHHISFVDCPGHENYMSNMLCGTSVIDMAFLVEAANAPIVPQPQTLEHLVAIQNTSVKEIVVIQNKCDLVSKQDLLLNKEHIEDFIEDYYGDELPIIPLIAQTGSNIGYIGKYLSSTLDKYSKDINLPLQINIIRTFDVNKPNKPIETLKGGVLGGSIVQGILFPEDIIQISPGICKKGSSGEWVVQPLFSKVKTINSEKNRMPYAIPGGLIGIGTLLDPGYSKANQLVGQIITRPNEHLDIATEITVRYKSFRRVEKVDKSLKKGEILKVGIICKHISGVVKSWSKKEKEIKIVLSTPACIDKGSVSIMKQIKGRYKIFSIGKIIKRKAISVEIPAEYISNKQIEYKITNDISKTKENEVYDYNVMVEQLDHSYTQKYKLQIPNIIISRTKNGRQQIIQNYETLLSSFANINDEQDIRVLFEKSMADELSCPNNINDKNKLLIHGKVKSTAITNSITKIIVKLRKCKVCKSYKTYVSRENRCLYMNCQECLSSSVISY